MADISALSHSTDGAPPPLDVQNVQALNVHTVQATLAGAWEELVGAWPVTSGDEKAVLAYRRTLSDPKAYAVLQIIWKESEFLSSAELQAAGLERAFDDGELTCHALAVASSATAADLGKVHKRLQKIVEAACAFSMIEKQAFTTKKHLLRGTAHLHQVMMQMAKTNVKVMADRFGLFGEGASA